MRKRISEAHRVLIEEIERNRFSGPPQEAFYWIRCTPEIEDALGTIRTYVQDHVRPAAEERRRVAASRDWVAEVRRLHGDRGMGRKAIARHMRSNGFPTITEKIIRTILDNDRKVQEQADKDAKADELVARLDKASAAANAAERERRLAESGLMTRPEPRVRASRGRQRPREIRPNR